jgi:hypothetical protein
MNKNMVKSLLEVKRQKAAHQHRLNPAQQEAQLSLQAALLRPQNTQLNVT